MPPKWKGRKYKAGEANASKNLRFKRITLTHLQLVIHGDEELDTLVHATITGGGVMPFIHKALTSLTAGKVKKAERATAAAA